MKSRSKITRWVGPWVLQNIQSSGKDPVQQIILSTNMVHIDCLIQGSQPYGADKIIPMFYWRGHRGLSGIRAATQLGALRKSYIGVRQIFQADVISSGSLRMTRSSLVSTEGEWFFCQNEQFMQKHGGMEKQGFSKEWHKGASWPSREHGQSQLF